MTQGPLDNTSEDFWEVVLKFDIKVIIGIIEERFLGKKCSKYWPRKKKDMKLGSVVLTVLDSQANELYEYKKISVSDGKK